MEYINEESKLNIQNEMKFRANEKPFSDYGCYDIPKDNKYVEHSEKSDTSKQYISPLNFIELPSVEIFSVDSPKSDKDVKSEKKYPHLTDLSYEDKLRISRLIEEVAKSRDRNIEDTKIITGLQQEKFKMTMDISKLDKEITKLLALCEEKDNEIVQISKKNTATVQDYKMQITELKLKADLTETQTAEKLTKERDMNKELMYLIKRLHSSYKNIKVKYKNQKAKLSRALTLIKDTMKVTCDEENAQTKEASCQVPSRNNSSSNISIKSIKKDQINNKECTEEQNQLDLQLISDLFFKVSLNNNFEEKDPFLFLMKDNILQYNDYKINNMYLDEHLP